jgi:hypothetical protein
MNVKPPCPVCPWRKTARASDIPNFRMDLAEGLAPTCTQDYDAAVFACHHSRPGEEFACAGFLAVHGRDNIRVRLAVCLGEIPVEALEPGEDWPELHASYDEMMDKLRRTL